MFCLCTLASLCGAKTQTPRVPCKSENLSTGKVRWEKWIEERKSGGKHLNAFSATLRGEGGEDAYLTYDIWKQCASAIQRTLP